MQTREEIVLVLNPLPADTMICDECFGTIWLDEVCKRCKDSGVIECKGKDGEPNCECHDCATWGQ